MTTVAQNDRFTDEPLAGDSAQFPLSRGSIASGVDECPSPAGTRPWGLRRMAPIPFEGVPSPAGHYDHERQVRVDGEGRPLIEMGPPTAPTTGQQDGDEGPSEEYLND
ncbi:putative ATP-grasp-modified RiPP [Amycolatopsis taiwanensis]|uniref:putative ATP-grasp-modified RiPP n=1 Tax=Amycolatopsis taiwanensis TaxID=342230 RepID=UPI0004B0584B|nr:putative ATP-grasp-modified RiPP [Amycolatopsis taiwanensis]